MNWKLNRISKTIGIIYLPFVVFLFYLLGNMMIGQGSSENDSIMTYLMCGGVLLFAGLLNVIVWLIRKKTVFSFSSHSAIWGVLECLFLLAIISSGVFFRIQMLPQMKSNAYFDTAVMRAGQTIPDLVHGAKYIYVQMLHLICYVLGNNLLFCVQFHMVLQIAAGIVGILAFRSLSDRIAGIVFAMFYFLTPSMIADSVVLGPAPFHFFVFAVALWFLSYTLKHTEGIPAVCVITGFLLAATIYLDAAGIAAFILLLTVFYADRGRSFSKINSHLGVFLLTSFSMVVFLGFLFFVDAGLSGKTVFGVVLAWLRLFFAQTGVDGLKNFVCFLGQDRYSAFALLGLMALGGIGFVFRIKDQQKESVTPFVLLILSLAILSAIGLSQSGLSLMYLFLSASAVCAGTGLSMLLPLKDIYLEEIYRSAPEGVIYSIYREEPEKDEEKEAVKASAADGEKDKERENDIDSAIGSKVPTDDVEKAGVRETPEIQNTFGAKESEIFTMDSAAEEPSGKEETADKKKKNLIVRFIDAKKQKKEDQRREAERVLQALSSLSADPLIAKGPEERKEVFSDKQKAAAKDTVKEAPKEVSKESAHSVADTHSSDDSFPRVEQLSAKTNSLDDSDDSDGKNPEEDRQKPKPLANPLPLPKKHVSNVMEYDYEVSDDDDFDIP